MRAIVLEKFGGLDSLVYKEIPEPEPKAGHVVIEIKAFGINHAEMHMRRGEWAEPAKVLGIECVGLVKSCPGGEFPVGGKVAVNRVTVSQDFLGVGNPFVLVLTNVCSMGVDLHHYCWDVVHYSPSRTPSEFEQKSGRIDRPRPRVLRRALNLGAERRSSAIRIHHLIWPFTYDERVFRRMNLRGHMSERLFGSKVVRDADDTTAEAFRRLRPLSLAPTE